MPKRNGILSTLGLNVRRAREAKELTQETLAERASLDPTYISGIERGLRIPASRMSPGLPRRSDSPPPNCAKGWTREEETQGKAPGSARATPAKDVAGQRTGEEHHVSLSSAC
jgi:DNA-binding XRE family transcriptional regulator